VPFSLHGSPPNNVLSSAPRTRRTSRTAYIFLPLAAGHFCIRALCCSTWYGRARFAHAPAHAASPLSAATAHGFLIVRARALDSAGGSGTWRHRAPHHERGFATRRTARAARATYTVATACTALPPRGGGTMHYTHWVADSTHIPTTPGYPFPLHHTHSHTGSHTTTVWLPHTYILQFPVPGLVHTFLRFPLHAHVTTTPTHTTGCTDPFTHGLPGLVCLFFFFTLSLPHHAHTTLRSHRALHSPRLPRTCIVHHTHTGYTVYTPHGLGSVAFAAAPPRVLPFTCAPLSTRFRLPLAYATHLRAYRYAARWQHYRLFYTGLLHITTQPTVLFYTATHGSCLRATGSAFSRGSQHASCHHAYYLYPLCAVLCHLLRAAVHRNRAHALPICLHRAVAAPRRAAHRTTRLQHRALL